MQRLVLLTFLAADCSLATELANPEQEVVSQATAYDPSDNVHRQIGADFKKKYEELAKAEKEAHLAAKDKQAKLTEAKAIVQESQAKVEEAKDEIKIVRAELNDKQQEVAAAIADKEKAVEKEKLDEQIIETAKNEENKVETAEFKVEQTLNQTLATDDAQGLNTQGESLVVQPKGTLSWGSTIFLFLILGSIVAVCSNTYRRQQLLDSFSSVSNHPMMAGFQSQDDALKMVGVAKQLSTGYTQYQVMP